MGNSDKQKTNKQNETKKQQKEGGKGELCPEITVVSIVVYREKYYDALISKDGISLYTFFFTFHTKRNHILYNGMIFCNIF